MTVNYANRGKTFESLIDHSNDIYKRKGIALINKRPTPVQILSTKGAMITRAVYSKKSTVDYDGVYKGRAITFEAKTTKGKSLPLSMVQDHQVDYLDDADDHGAISFIIVNFSDLDKTYILSNEILSNYRNNAIKGARKSIPIMEFEDNGIEVTSQNGLPLDYLSKIKELTT